MSKSEGGDQKPEQIQLTALGLSELAQIKQELEQDCNGIQDSLQTLHNCKGKYSVSKEVLEAIQPEWQDRQILVPMTGSMYVPGRIKDVDSFMLDIGTGYYVEKNLADTKDYFKRRVDYVQEQIENIERIQLQKTRFLHAVNSVLEMKQQANNNSNSGSKTNPAGHQQSSEDSLSRTQNV